MEDSRHVSDCSSVTDDDIANEYLREDEDEREDVNLQRIKAI